jgi:uncharacterized protein
MLGTLARWLRILGYDTEYERDVDDDVLVRCCVAEGRIALTKDRKLVERRALRNPLLIHSKRLGGQIREVLAVTGDDPSERPVLSRCVECNSPLQDVSREAVRDRVPPYVFRTQQEFRSCPSCGRIYWAGTHRQRMLERLDKLLSDTGEETGRMGTPKSGSP